MPNYYTVGQSTKIVKTAAQFAAQNRVMVAGAVGRETDTGKEKTGDGVSSWNDLPYDGGDAEIAAPDYSYEGTSGEWTVVPGQNPGSAVFRSYPLYSTDTPSVVAGLNFSRIPFSVSVPNDNVATLVDQHHFRFAAAGLYLVSVYGSLYPIGPFTGPEEHLQIDMNPYGLPSHTWSNIAESLMNSYGVINFGGSGAVMALNDLAFDGVIELRSSTYIWQGQAQITVVRLD